MTSSAKYIYAGSSRSDAAKAARRSMEAERTLTKLYPPRRGSAPMMMMSDGSLVRNPLTMRGGRTPASMRPYTPPQVYKMRLGEGGASDYDLRRYGNPRIHPPMDADLGIRLRLTPLSLLRTASGFLDQASAMSRIVGMLQNGAQPWFLPWKFGEPQFPTTLPTGYFWCCGSPAGANAVVQHNRSACGIPPCGLLGQALTPSKTIWGHYYTFRYTTSGGQIRHDVLGMTSSVSTAPGYTPQMVNGPTKYQAFAPIWSEQPLVRMPYVLLPYRPVAVDPRLGTTRSYHTPGQSGVKPHDKPSWQTTPRFGEPPPPIPVRGLSPWTPPGSRTKERKAKAPPFLVKAAGAAFAATEGADVVDALFDALPESIQRTVPKTGTVSRTGFNPGMKYATPIDKAMHVYRNINAMDVSEAIKNMIVNHLTDKVIGTASGKTGRMLQGRGITGAGFAF